MTGHVLLQGSEAVPAGAKAEHMLAGQRVGTQQLRALSEAKDMQ